MEALLSNSHKTVTAWPKISIQFHPAVVLLEWAALRSYSDDVRSPEVLDALAELQAVSDYSAPFAAYRRALDLEDHQARWTAALMAFASIAGALNIKRLEPPQQPVPIAEGTEETFLMKELEAGLLLADIALKTGSCPEKARDCARHARNAYNVVVRCHHRSVSAEKSVNHIEDRLSRLRSALENLGELV